MRNKEIRRKANKLGLTIKECKRGTIYIDPITGKSIYNGKGSQKSFRQERRMESFLREAGNSDIE